MKSFLFLSLLIFCSCGSRKYITYAETKNNLTNKSYKNLLIVGTGTSGTRLFLENLSLELNNKLEKKGVKTYFYHLGANPSDANQLFNQIIQRQQFDAVLQFVQMDKDHNAIIVKRETGDVIARGNIIATYDFTYEVIRYQQKFLVKFFDISDFEQSLADAKMQVNINSANAKDYTQLVKEIIFTLRL